MIDTPLADAALMHHGVKGQKWGVRKEVDLSRVVSKVERKAANKHLRTEFTNAAFDARFERIFNKSGLGITPYSKLSTKDSTIRKGAEFYRTTPRKDDPLRDFTYVSNNQADRNRYKAVLSKEITFGKRQNYEAVYKTTQKLTLPSEKARLDAFNEILDTQSVKVGRKTITGKEYLKRIGYSRDVRKLDTMQLGQKVFNEVNSTAYLNTPIASAYFNNLKSKGYNALIDDNDHKIVSNSPLIILNPNGSLKRMSIKQLDKKDVVEAKRNIKRL